MGEYCHWGATTQDITDTATVLQIREGLAIVDDKLAAISAALSALARRYRDTPVVGRSNLQQAIPAQILVFLKTGAGLALALAVALDRVPFDGVVGSIAGDDTILLVTLDADTARRVADHLLSIARAPA